MALNDIKQSITQQAQQRADEIISQARSEANTLKQEWDKKHAEKQVKLLTAAQKKAQQKIQQASFSLQAQAQTLVLNKKQKALESVYVKALEELSKLDDVALVELFTSLLDKLPAVEGEIKATEAHQSAVKKALKKSDAKATVSKEVIKAKGGFVFISDSVEIDNTFETLINNIKEAITLDVANLLFETEQE